MTTFVDPPEFYLHLSPDKVSAKIAQIMGAVDQRSDKTAADLVTPLMRAIGMGRVQVNGLDSNGHTPLGQMAHCSATLSQTDIGDLIQSDNCLELIDTLVRQGAKPLLYDRAFVSMLTQPMSNLPALIWSSALFMRMAEEEGARMEEVPLHRDTEGNNPLHLVAAHQSERIALALNAAGKRGALLERWAGERNGEGLTPLLLLWRSDNPDIQRLIGRHGEDAQTALGARGGRQQAEYLAAHWHCHHALAAFGIDDEAVDAQGNTAGQLIAQWKHKGLVEVADGVTPEVAQAEVLRDRLAHQAPETARVERKPGRL